MTGPPDPDANPTWSPRHTNILAVLVIIIAVLGVLLWKVGGSGSSATGSGPAAESTEGDSRDAQLGQVVERLDDAWAQRDRKAFIAAAGTSDDAHAWARQTYANLLRLDVKAFHARFVAENADGIGPDGTFTGDVQVSWKPGNTGKPDHAASGGTTEPVSVSMVFRPAAEGYDIEGVRPGGDPLPLWLLGGLRVEHRGKVDVVYVDRAKPSAIPARLKPEKVTRASKRARRAVREVSDESVGSPLVVVPSDSSQSAALLGQQNLGQIAAVTSTVDGSTKPGSASYVVLNPSVYATMNKRAAQIVLTHEVTHAVTGAAAKDMPLWVAEGFADYVALHDDDLGVRKSASQILERVRRNGPPAKLPGDDEFGATRHGLGATYEGAWLVFELLHLRAPDEQIVDFYDDVRGGRDVGAALEERFGLDVESLTDLWRDYLTDLADKSG